MTEDKPEKPYSIDDDLEYKGTGWTPEPWKACELWGDWFVRDQNDIPITRNQENYKANAQRIVACVNSFAEIKDEFPELYADPSLLEYTLTQLRKPV